MDASSRVEEDRKISKISADVGSSGGHANTAKNTADKRPKQDSRRAWDIAVEQGGELEHIVKCDEHWRRHARKRWDWEPTSACFGHTGGAHGTSKPCGPGYTRSCISSGSSGCTAESPANRESVEETDVLGDI